MYSLAYGFLFFVISISGVIAGTACQNLYVTIWQDIK
jgi:hypothetical protein